MPISSCRRRSISSRGRWPTRYFRPLALSSVRTGGSYHFASPFTASPLPISPASCLRFLPPLSSLRLSVALPPSSSPAFFPLGRRCRRGCART